MSNFRPPDSDPSTAYRIVQAALGLLNLTILGMMLYLRLGPFARLMRRMGERGIAVPDWIPLLLTTGVVVVGGYVAWRGMGHLREAVRRPDAPRGGRARP